MNMNQNRRNALGRGLGALLSASDAENLMVQATSNSMIPVQQIEVNPLQPRTEFDEKALKELSASIKTHGIIQPVTVRRLAAGQYQLISGERRLRASRLAGLKEVPAFVVEATHQNMLEMALVENIQRADLYPMEIALSLSRLQEECQVIHEELGERVGKDRSTVTNYMRLLKLPPEIQSGIRDGKLDMGHAKALMGLERVEVLLEVYRRAIAQKMSVRQLEALVKSMKEGGSLKKVSEKTLQTPPEYRISQEQLKRQYESAVQIRVNGKGGGEISIPFSDPSDLNRLLDMLLEA
jgi:ParB family chromosome partitioning protein